MQFFFNHPNGKAPATHGNVLCCTTIEVETLEKYYVNRACTAAVSKYPVTSINLSPATRTTQQ